MKVVRSFLYYFCDWRFSQVEIFYMNCCVNIQKEKIQVYLCRDSVILLSATYQIKNAHFSSAQSTLRCLLLLRIHAGCCTKAFLGSYSASTVTSIAATVTAWIMSKNDKEKYLKRRNVCAQASLNRNRLFT